MEVVNHRSSFDGRGSRSLQSIPRCDLSSKELSELNHTTRIGPCTLYDIDPIAGAFSNSSNSSNSSGDNTAPFGNTTSVLTLVQVTPHYCRDHRDGTVAGVEHLNADNGGRGLQVGYFKDHHVSVTMRIRTRPNWQVSERQIVVIATVPPDTAGVCCSL